MVAPWKKFVFAVLPLSAFSVSLPYPQYTRILRTLWHSSALAFPRQCLYSYGKGCYHKIPGSLNNKNLFSHSSGDWQSKTQVLAGCVCDRALRLVCNVLTSPGLSSVGAGSGGGGGWWWNVFYGHWSHQIRAPPLRPHLTLTTFLEAPSPHTESESFSMWQHKYSVHNNPCPKSSLKPYFPP